jgi:SAM-dependent methyltransferase
VGGGVEGVALALPRGAAGQHVAGYFLKGYDAFHGSSGGSIAQVEKGPAMTPATQQRLLDLNRAFYAAIGDMFDLTRHSLAQGMVQALDYLPASDGPLRVLDAGCGNGRFARAFEQAGRPAAYVGVDADARLLAHARAQTADLRGVEAAFVQADLAEAGWDAALGRAAFDAIMCFATLHHFPGRALRGRIARDLAALLAPGGRLIVSAWQFLIAPRLAEKRVPWETIGLSAADVEPGDALLPWQQGTYALRYVHQIDVPELEGLGRDAGLASLGHFFADGKEGNLSLYGIFTNDDTTARGSAGPE